MALTVPSVESLFFDLNVYNPNDCALDILVTASSAEPFTVCVSALPPSTNICLLSAYPTESILVAKAGKLA